jgi:hypothetical protein
VRALVTGGGGFLGEALVRALVARGDQVRVLARGDYPHLRALGSRRCAEICAMPRRSTPRAARWRSSFTPPRRPVAGARSASSRRPTSPAPHTSSTAASSTGVCWSTRRARAWCTCTATWRARMSRCPTRPATRPTTRAPRPSPSGRCARRRWLRFRCARTSSGGRATTTCCLGCWPGRAPGGCGRWAPAT